MICPIVRVRVYDRRGGQVYSLQHQKDSAEDLKRGARWESSSFDMRIEYQKQYFNDMYNFLVDHFKGSGFRPVIIGETGAIISDITEIEAILIDRGEKPDHKPFKPSDIMGGFT